MSDNTHHDAAEATSGAPVSGATRTNERSEIAFPYLDLDAGVEVAQKIYARAGISSCPLDELAAEMGQTTSSGNFRLKTATARVFGLVLKDGQSGIKLSDLGSDAISQDVGTSSDARSTAFLQVPLYLQIYEKYRGKLLPPTKALEREMQTLGVSSKQLDSARRAFQRSAKQAGFFNSGEDRLVKPKSNGLSNVVPETIDQPKSEKASSDLPHKSAATATNVGLHPFVQGLLQTMPEAGTVWEAEGRAAWLQTAANIFTLIYKGEEKILAEVEKSTSHK
jgi:hypothetical protein